MALATTLYFPEVGPQWEDWIQVINVGTEETRVTGIARHAANGKPTWTDEKEISPFEMLDTERRGNQTEFLNAAYRG